MQNIEEFHKHVIEEYPKEAVGILKEDIYIPYVNVHPEPIGNFLLEQEVSFSLMDDRDYTLLHSHTTVNYDGTDPRVPTLHDMATQKNLGVSCGIVHCDGEAVSDILYFGPPSDTPLRGREYIHNVYDCFTLGRDFYWQNYGIDVGSFPRPLDWQGWNPHSMEHNYEKLGFVKVRREDVAYGDTILYRLGSVYANHISICLGNNTILHHLYERLSGEDSLSKWDRQFVNALRYIHDPK